MADTINKLYNLDANRTLIYEQDGFIIPLDCGGKVFLDHIPKKGTLYIKDKTLQLDVTLVDNKEPASGEAYIDYREEYDYAAAKGIVIFNANDVSLQHEYYIRYVPVASRVDATVINALIDAAGGFGSVWTKKELALEDPEQKARDSVDWEVIKNRPGLATPFTKNPDTGVIIPGVNGLLSTFDKTKLDEIPSISEVGAPYTSIIFTTAAGANPFEFSPTLWGDPVTLTLEDGLFIKEQSSKKFGRLGLDETAVRNLIGYTSDIKNALKGTIWETSDVYPYVPPSETNRFVTSKDPRMTDARAPLEHTHLISDIIGLLASLNNKADLEHEHSVDDISGIEALRGEDGISPTIEISEVAIVEGDQLPSVENISGNPLNVKLKFTLPKGQKGDPGTVTFDNLTAEQKATLKGDKGDAGVSAAILVGSVNTSEPGSQVQIATDGIEERYIDGRVYNTTTLHITIPRGDKGDQGLTGTPTYMRIGAVTTLDNNEPASVTVSEPVEEEIDGKLYSVSTINFALPRGPKGNVHTTPITFLSTDAWSEMDEDENYTLILPNTTGAIPTSPVYEDLGDGSYELIVATVKFDYSSIKIIADHKFSGRIYIEGA